ncbi:MAG: iron-containing alcohol dehydrogenase [Omnitrophica bacterium]|nr:iron-containing alcohol dehydrogenase [Candidatus Omnitrophota bacterium]
MLNFTYDIPTRIHFGRGEIKALSGELETCAKKVLVVTGQGSVKRNGIFNDVVREIKKAGIPFVELTGIKPNPRLKSVYRGIEICKAEGVDFILAVGGGSVIDASKAIAAGAKYKNDVWDFFTKDVVCTEAVPLGAVLTLAATGSEMNSYGVITKEDTERKLAFGTPLVRPVFSILDPEYTYTVNKYHTSAGIVDIMVHIFEEYFSAPPTAVVQDRIAEALLKVCIKYGPIACKKPKDYEARANILWAGTLALNGLLGNGKSGDWASHGIEHEISAIYDITHGVGLGIIVPNWMKVVLSKNTLDKFVEFGINVWDVDKDKGKEKIANIAIEKTRDFFTALGVPSKLSAVSVPQDRFRDMAKGAIESYGQVGSFKKLSEEDIVKILTFSL